MPFCDRYLFHDQLSHSPSRAQPRRLTLRVLEPLLRAALCALLLLLRLMPAGRVKRLLALLLLLLLLVTRIETRSTE